MAASTPVMSLYHFLKSKKLALITIAVLTMLSAIGMIVPQEAVNIFSSVWFLAVAFVFFINLTLCTLSQTVSLTRGFRLGIWGKSFFHLGLVIIVIGGFVSTGFKTSGFMMVGEGETQIEEHENYRRIEEGLFFREDMHEGLEITLLKQNPVFNKEGRVTYISSHVEIRDNGVTASHWVEKGSPMVYKNYRFFHNISGYALPVIVKNGEGQIVFGSYLILNTEEDGEAASYFVAEQQLGDLDYSVDLEFFPDARVKDGKIFNRSDAPRSPKVKVIINTDKGSKSYGIVSLNQKLVLENGQTIEFTGELKRWVGLEIVNDPGASILFFGGWVSLLGAVMYFTQGLQLKIKEA